MRQNRHHHGRLDQFLDAVHPAKDSPPYQDADAPAPADRCDGAGCRSNGQENRSEENIHHLAAERFQSCICRVHAIHLKAPFRFSGLVLSGMKSAMDKEWGKDRLTPAYSLNSPSAQNCKLRERAMPPTTEEGVSGFWSCHGALGKHPPPRARSSAAGFCL